MSGCVWGEEREEERAGKREVETERRGGREECRERYVEEGLRDRKAAFKKQRTDDWTASFGGPV